MCATKGIVDGVNAIKVHMMTPGAKKKQTPGKENTLKDLTA